MNASLVFFPRSLWIRPLCSLFLDIQWLRISSRWRKLGRSNVLRLTKRFVTVLPRPSAITEICFAVTPGVNIPAKGGNGWNGVSCVVAIYFSFDNGMTWSILGTVTSDAPRYVLMCSPYIVVSSVLDGERSEWNAAIVCALVFRWKGADVLSLYNR